TARCDPWAVSRRSVSRWAKPRPAEDVRIRGVQPQWRIVESVQYFDAEAGSANGRGGVAVGVTTSGEAGIQRRDRVLEESEPWLLGADVFEKAKLARGFQYPLDLSQRRVRIRDRAQHERDNRGVEPAVFNR